MRETSMLGGGRRLTFDRYVVDLGSRELFRDGHKVSIQEKPLRLLVALLERPGEVVSREELYDALWPREAWVERQAGLHTAVRKLRAALASPDGAQDSRLVETIPRVGYRLNADPVLQPEPGLVPGTAIAGAPSVLGRGRGAPAQLALAVALVLATILILAGWPRGAGDPRPEPMPADPAVRVLYLEARGLLTGNDRLPRARQLLQEVVAASPRFAPAHAYLAEAAARTAWRSGKAGDIAAARSAAARAIALDRESAVAHRIRAMIAMSFDWDLPKARSEIERALAAAPEDPINHLARATYFSILGQHDRAVASVRRAVALEPGSMAIRSDAGYFLLRAGRYSEAISECSMAVRLAPDLGFAHECLVTAHGLAGDLESVRPHALHLMVDGGADDTDIQRVRSSDDPFREYVGWALERLLTSPEPRSVQIASRYLALGQPERALDWLERAAQARERGLVYVRAHSAFGVLRGHPRYQRLLQRLGLGSA